MPQIQSDPAGAAWIALRAGRWEAARALFEQSLAAEVTPRALEAADFFELFVRPGTGAP